MSVFPRFENTVKPGIPETPAAPETAKAQGAATLVAKTGETGNSTPSDTYKTVAAAKSDQAALRQVLARLRLPERWLKLDACGCWHIAGPEGSIYAHSDKRGWLGGFLLTVQTESARRWSAIKAKTAYRIRQDGDADGVLLFDLQNINPPLVRLALGCRN